MIIGLTGNIASGKSSVAKYLKELGAEILDADQVARKIVLPQTPALKEIIDSFGPGILNEDRTLNRKKLGEIVFSDHLARTRLEEITHPRIEEAINQEIKTFTKSNPNGILVIEAALLIEAGWHKNVDQVWLVTVNLAEQLKRLMTRDKLSEDQAHKRIASQMSQAEKRHYATVIIDNSGTATELRKRVNELWQLIAQH